MKRAVLEAKRDEAETAALIVCDEVECEILDEELRTAAHRLPIERVQYGVSSTVGRGTASPHGWPLAVVGIVTAEWTLIDLPVIGTGERHAVVLKLIDRRRRIPAQVLDCILVTEPIGALDRVIHMPTPVVGTLVSKGGCDTALRRHGVGAGWKHLCYACRAQSRLDSTERRSQSCASSADDHHVIGMVCQWVSRANERRCSRRHHVRLHQNSSEIIKCRRFGCKERSPTADERDHSKRRHSDGKASACP